MALFSYIFVVWAFYRHFPEMLPVWFEELAVKPVLWLGPTLWLASRVEGESWASLGFTRKNLRLAIYLGVGLGMVFAFEGFLANIFKYKGLNLVDLRLGRADFLAAFGLSVVTAVVEETVFRGYIFTRLNRLWKNELKANLASSALFALIYLPVVVFVLSYQPASLLAYLLFVFAYGVAAAYIFARTENLLSSIILHIFWSWPILLFR